MENEKNTPVEAAPVAEAASVAEAAGVTVAAKPSSDKKHKIIELALIIIIILLLGAVITTSIILLNKSNNLNQDTLLVKRLNEAIAADVKAGKTHPTMQDALDCVATAGYIVERINVSSGENEILWDSVNDLFCYFDAEKNEIIYIPDYQPATKPADVAYFKIYQNGEIKPLAGVVDFTGNNSRFSAYLAKNDAVTAVKTDKGFDAGTNVCILTIDYSYAKNREIILRSNGGDLTIDALKSTVNHYGKANAVALKSVDTHSYHEYGEVLFLSVKEGNIVLTAKADVTAIHFVKSGEKDDKNADTFNEIIVTVEKDATLPAFSRDDVVINSTEGTKVCFLNMETDKEYIYLFQQGVYEQIKVAKADDSDKLVWIDKSDANEDTQIVAEQIANNYNGAIKWENDDDSTRVLDLDGEHEVEEIGKLAEEVKNEVVAEAKVKAYISDVKDTPVVDFIYDLTEGSANLIAGASVKLDDAYIFSALSEGDAATVAIFLAAKKANGDPIFVVPNDFTDANIELAYNYMKDHGNSDAVDAMKAIFAAKSSFLNWKVDWEVSFDKDVDAATVVLAGAYGAYEDNLWVGFELPRLFAKNETVKLMENGAAMFNNKDGEWSQNYLQILAYVQEFKCGFANLSADNVGTKITVTLCIYSPDGTQRIECATTTCTLGAVSEANTPKD